MKRFLSFLFVISFLGLTVAMASLPGVILGEVASAAMPVFEGIE